MTTADREAPHHNTLNCVKRYGCTRIECRDRVAAYQREWRLKQNGQASFVDATPVREHLLLLAEARIGTRRVAILTGLAEETVAGFTRSYGASGKRYGRKKKVRPDVAAKILAINPDTTIAGITSTIGSRRRIQALGAAGWPIATVASRLPSGNTTAVTILRRDHLQARHAEAIADVFDELKDLRPEEHGVHPTSAHRARLRAERNQWPPIAYWADRMDVINDPHFQPEYGISKRELVAREAGWIMLNGGLNREAAAGRLGVHKSYVDHALRDHPEYAVEAAA